MHRDHESNESNEWTREFPACLRSEVAFRGGRVIGNAVRQFASRFSANKRHFSRSARRSEMATGITLISQERDGHRKRA